MDLVGGAMDPRGSYVSKILHVNMKESGPVGGVPGVPPLDPPMPCVHLACGMTPPNIILDNHKNYHKPKF